MTCDAISFLTPYWSGREMMRIHLESIRKFYPAAPILVSKRGGDPDEMEGYRRAFGIRYWLEDCEFPAAYVRLLQRCETEYVCILDHDAVLLATLDPYLKGLTDGRYDLVGVEERIRVPDEIWTKFWPHAGGWLRFAPGCTDSNFIMFNLRAFKARWGLRGIFGTQTHSGHSFEFCYGICQKLTRHYYLLPYHLKKYGMGNLLKDGATPVLWHQWYGSYRTRLAETAPENQGAAEPDDRTVYLVAKEGELAFIDDYPRLDLSGLAPAWGPDLDIRAEQLAIAASAPSGSPGGLAGIIGQLRRWKSYGMREFTARAWAKLDMWWRLL